MSLPDTRTIRLWLSSHSCNPGFLLEVFSYLKEQVVVKSDLKYVSLVFDSMHIRKGRIYNKNTGHVNYGGIVEGIADVLASEALVFMLVSYITKFKCPMAYFFTHSSNADVQKQLLLTAITLLYDIGINVKSITCEGSSVNSRIPKLLGCNFSSQEFISHFSHPNTGDNISTTLDPCYMLKLARNCMCDRTIESPIGIISWEYIRRLQK